MRPGPFSTSTIGATASATRECSPRSGWYRPGYSHTEEPDTPNLWAVTTAEGSSRTTGAHDILGVGNSVDAVVKAQSDTFMRGRIKELNTAFEQGPNVKQSEALRCETMPGLILVTYSTAPRRP